MGTHEGALRAWEIRRQRYGETGLKNSNPVPICYKCGVVLDEQNWPKHRARKREYVCFECNRKIIKDWRVRNRAKFRVSASRCGRRYRYKLKMEILRHYSGEPPRCSCGFDDVRALTIDHINGRGNEHRRQLRKIGGTFYQWLKGQGFPSGYQVLCMNCQMIKKYKNNEWGR